MTYGKIDLGEFCPPKLKFIYPHVIDHINLMKLAIVGSRTFTDYEVFQTILLEHYQISEIETIISGGATGFDTLAEKFAHQYNSTHSGH